MKLQELNELVNGLTDEHTREALADIERQLGAISDHADSDNLQAVDQLVDAFTSKQTLARLDEFEGAIDAIADKADALKELNDTLDQTCSNVRALIELVDQLNDRVAFALSNRIPALNSLADQQDD